jgi:hypothetical protein
MALGHLFAKLEIYEDKIIFKLLFSKVVIPPKSVEHVERIGGIPILADGVYLKLNDPNLPFSVAFFSFINGRKIVGILNKICTNQKPKRGYFENPYNAIALIAWPLVVVFVLNSIFHIF